MQRENNSVRSDGRARMVRYQVGREEKRQDHGKDEGTDGPLPVVNLEAKIGNS